MTKVFIDGKEGTTGLRIFDRLSSRDDVSLITLPDDLRKDINARKEAINSSDIVFLCLPDAAAVEAVSLVENENVRIIDASTAHRTSEGWAYGLPELSAEHKESIRNGKRIANPGCHASGFIALVYPLVKNGILPKDALLCCHSLTGYSGGGKKMIAEYESEDRNVLLSTPRQYGLSQTHKHLKEMKHISMLDTAPMFSPIVDDFYSGMEMTVQLFASQLNKGFGIEDVKKVYKELYTSPAVRYVDFDGKAMLAAGELSGMDNMIVSVFGNEERILLTSVYDNLGKGASGAAVQCMNIMTGADEYKGLFFNQI
ncbi:MAG: N-acetyl-gamma-glutamyl-phosphate reductase [Ruminococcaceae bacterium]|nr:N-acetyl-gamma-glutamyl-phosphate reductase [Oscillospiraceae bacterium]